MGYTPVLSQRISSERSLSFISAGQRIKIHEENSGSAQVKRIVSEFVKFGNDSVFGLIDWDKKNKSQGQIFVLAENKRYAIENCLLDPLLVGASAFRLESKLAERIGLAPTKQYVDFRDLTPEECQNVIDCVERKVLRLPDGAEFSGRMEVKYVSGLSVQASSSYLLMPGHKLEECVKLAFPVFCRYQKSGELLLNIIDPVICELTDFVPLELLEIFETILRYEPDAAA